MASLQVEQLAVELTQVVPFKQEPDPQVEQGEFELTQVDPFKQ